MTSSIKVRQFDWMSIKPNCIFLLVGSRGTGKTSWIVNFVQQNPRRFSTVQVFSPTATTSRAFTGLVPPAFVFPSPDKEHIEKFIKRQKILIERNPGNKDIATNLSIIDDCGYDSGLWNKKHIRDLFMNGRHVRTTLIVALQYAYDIGPGMRTQTDYVIVFDVSTDLKRKLYDAFFVDFGSFELFSETLNEITGMGKGHCMVFLAGGTTRLPLSERVFWCYCENPETMTRTRAFHPSIWKYSDQFFNADDTPKRGSASVVGKLPTSIPAPSKNVFIIKSPTDSKAPISGPSGPSGSKIPLLVSTTTAKDTFDKESDAEKLRMVEQQLSLLSLKERSVLNSIAPKGMSVTRELVEYQLALFGDKDPDIPQFKPSYWK